jgi:DNA-binding CsgD family transcriptional regulator
VLRLTAAGHTNTQIARRLGISEGTVRTAHKVIHLTDRPVLVIR